MVHKKCIASWSGGKDSCLAAYKALQQGYDIKTLLHFVSEETKRSCFHGIAAPLMQLQAEALCIPMALKEVSPDMHRYEHEFKEAVGAFKDSGIGSMVFGDIYLIDHQSWVERVCKEIGIIPLEPLWNRQAYDIAAEFIDLGFKSIIVSAKADLFDEGFVGRSIDKDMLSELKERNICPCGENGEFHSFVVDGPLFKKRIEILESKPVLKQGFWKHWFLDIKKYCLTGKHEGVK